MDSTNDSWCKMKLTVNWLWAHTTDDSLCDSFNVQCIRRMTACVIHSMCNVSDLCSRGAGGEATDGREHSKDLRASASSACRWQSGRCNRLCGRYSRRHDHYAGQVDAVPALLAPCATVSHCLLLTKSLLSWVAVVDVSGSTSITPCSCSTYDPSTGCERWLWLWLSCCPTDEAVPLMRLSH